MYLIDTPQFSKRLARYNRVYIIFSFISVSTIIASKANNVVVVSTGFPFSRPLYLCCSSEEKHSFQLQGSSLGVSSRQGCKGVQAARIL